MDHQEIFDYFDQCLDLKSLGFVNTNKPHQMLYVAQKKNTQFFLGYDIISDRFYGMNIWMSFNEIEDLLNPLLIKYGMPTDAIPFTLSFYKLIPTVTHPTLEVPILTDSNSIEIAAKLVHTYIKDVYLPIWEKYSLLQTINDEILNNIPQQTLSDYLPSRVMSWKKLIIMKICKNDRFEEYRNWLNEIYQKQKSENHVDAEKKEALFTELCNLLKSK